MARWTFADNSTTYTFEINPNAGGSPRLTKQIVASPRCGAGATGPVYFQGRPKIGAGTISGVARSSAQVQALDDWVKTHAQIVVTDDLGRSFTIVALSIRFAYDPRHSAAWRHTYSLDYLLLNPVVV